MRKQYWLMPILLVLAMSFVAAQGIERTVPTQVNPGESFTVSYTTVNAPTTKYFVVIEETLSGGCTVPSGDTTYGKYLVEEAGGDVGFSQNIIAPSSGSCKIEGSYYYADGSQKLLPQKTVTIGSTSSYCGDGTCNADESQSSCPADCGTSGPVCGNGVCESGETTSSCAADCDTGNGDGDGGLPEGWCNIASKADFFDITGDPCTNGTIIIIGLFVLVIIVLK